MRTYRNMKSRVLGIQKKKAHLYKGLPLLPKEEFYSWSKNNQDFLMLFNTWITADYNQKLTPSIDRINSKLGYKLDNIRWITLSENSLNGTRSRYAQN